MLLKTPTRSRMQELICFGTSNAYYLFCTNIPCKKITNPILASPNIHSKLTLTFSPFPANKKLVYLSECPTQVTGSKQRNSWRILMLLLLFSITSLAWYWPNSSTITDPLAWTKGHIWNSKSVFFPVQLLMVTNCSGMSLDQEEGRSHN